MPQWYDTQEQLDKAVADLRALGPAARRLLGEAVAADVLERKPSEVAERLCECGFVHIGEIDYWTKKAKIKSSLWGEEALEALEQQDAAAAKRPVRAPRQ